MHTSRTLTLYSRIDKSLCTPAGDHEQTTFSVIMHTRSSACTVELISHYAHRQLTLYSRIDQSLCTPEEL